mmetsp:Transcript_5940/g.24866  ORF Transcript_5940/g.24866 Transcript_5940/m.24866 type:complete len:226 (-) Transcript_5940:251-928(-)
MPQRPVMTPDDETSPTSVHTALCEGLASGSSRCGSTTGPAGAGGRSGADDAPFFAGAASASSQAAQKPSPASRGSASPGGAGSTTFGASDGATGEVMTRGSLLSDGSSDTIKEVTFDDDAPRSASALSTRAAAATAANADSSALSSGRAGSLPSSSSSSFSGPDGGVAASATSSLCSSVSSSTGGTAASVGRSGAVSFTVLKRLAPSRGEDPSTSIDASSGVLPP